MLQAGQNQIRSHVQAVADPLRGWAGALALTVIVGIVYFLAARLSLALLSREGVAVFWPAAGVSSGALIALGRSARWPVVAGTMETIQPLVFYSPDHPSPFTPNEAWSSGLTSPEDVKKYGFIGVFDPTDGRLPAFEKWVAETAPNAERMVMTTRRFTGGKAGPAMTWNVYIAPPAN